MRHRPEAFVMARVSRRIKLWHPVPVFGFGTVLAMCLQPLSAVAQPVRERVSVGVVSKSRMAVIVEDRDETYLAQHTVVGLGVARRHVRIGLRA